MHGNNFMWKQAITGARLKILLIYIRLWKWLLDLVSCVLCVPAYLWMASLSQDSPEIVLFGAVLLCYTTCLVSLVFRSTHILWFDPSSVTIVHTARIRLWVPSLLCLIVWTSLEIPESFLFSHIYSSLEWRRPNRIFLVAILSHFRLFGRCRESNQ